MGAEVAYGMFIHCRWTLKPEFGEVPQYLVKNKQQIAEEKARVEEHLRLRQQQVRQCQTMQRCMMPVTGLHIIMTLYT